MTLQEAFNKYGEPLYVGTKHLVWRDAEQNRAIKATRPGYLSDGSVILTSQSWYDPADASSPYPTDTEVADFMENYGFSQVNLSDWTRADGTVARDVKLGDFIKTKNGVVPIDVCLERPRSHN